MRNVAILVTMLVLLVSTAQAGTWVTRPIERLFVDATKINDPVYGEVTRYGGCAVKLIGAINGEQGLAACNSVWITFDCAGSMPTTNKSVAKDQWSVAQLAFVTGKSVRVEVDGLKDVSGFCYAVGAAVVN